jgi:DNA primase
MAFDPRFLDEIRQRLSLAGVVGRRVRLTKRGRDYVGLCPFHKEKTPSFNVVEDKAFYHCFAAETRVMTREGAREIATLAGSAAEVLTRGGRWVRAEFANYGRQALWRIELSRNGVAKTIFATSGHRWFVRGRQSAVLTKDLRVGHRLQSVLPARRKEWQLDPAGVRHGVVFGDGTLQNGIYGHVHLHGRKDEPLAAWFPDQTPVRREYACGKPYLRIYGGRAFAHMKSLPRAEASDEYLLGFLAGYIAADGHVAKDGTVMLHSAERRHLEWVRDVATRLGIGTFDLTVAERRGFSASESDIYRIHFVSSTLDKAFFLGEEARTRFSAAEKDFERLRWSVVSVAPTERVEDVFCADVPVEHAFALEDNILTGNCFGCGAHGDVIGFTMRVENLGFRESVEQLARQAGLELPVETPAARAEAARATTLNEACAAAAEAFEQQLWSPPGTPALAYLRERGLGEDLIRKFRLGWAPDGRGFVKGALGARFPEALLVEAGLLRQGEQGAFDFFRGRVIFPICDRAGRVIAFGGRTMGDGQPKYLNSPDTPIFQKGRTLYGLHLARAAAGAEAPPIVTEGYMDVIALHGAGFGTAVAPLGTALTEEHLAELWRVHAEPVVCFDGDTAGQRAAIRTLDRALPHLTTERSLKFVSLPAKHDPDSLIREKGAAAMREALGGAASVSEFLWASATENRVFATVETIAQLEAQLLRRLRTIGDRGLQFHLRRFVSDQTSALYWKHRKRRRAKESGGKHLSARLGAAENPWRSAAVLLAGAVNHPAIAADDVDRFVMIRSDDPGLARLAEAILAEVEARHDVAGPALRERLCDRGFAPTLAAIERSEIWQAARFLHSGADPYDAALGWRALFSRALLPEARRELAAATAEWERAQTAESWDRVERLRRLVTEQNSEAELVPLQRDPIDRWRPPPAAA